VWGWQEAWSNSPVGFMLPVFRKTHLVSGIMKTKQSWNLKSKEELNEPSGTVTSHMSSESRDYASCYLGAVSRGPAASELTRGGLSGELLSPTCQYTPCINTTPYDKRQPPLSAFAHRFSLYGSRYDLQRLVTDSITYGRPVWWERCTMTATRHPAQLCIIEASLPTFDAKTYLNRTQRSANQYQRGTTNFIAKH
jgi:hypothetical protein